VKSTFNEEIDMKQLFGILMMGLMVSVVGFVGCGRDSSTGKVSLVCNQFADAHWSPTDYLTWRNSTISRNSSITHALPCSVEVETGRLEGLADCNSSEKQQYYELIGKYDQFISGWIDAKEVETGNPVQPTQIDSVEKYFSETRQAYEECRAGNISSIE
jgi:hypothetical protein